MNRRIIAMGAGIATSAVAALTLSSCGSGQAVTETVPVDITASKVTLTDRGAGDVATVRWKDDGAEQDVSVVVTQGFVQKGLNDQADSTFPDTRLEMPLKASSTAGASRSVTATVGTPFGSNAELNDDIGSAEGFVMEWAAQNSGRIDQLKMGAPKSASTTARAGIESALKQLTDMPIIFPDQEIGDGASWTVEGEQSNSAMMKQKITYTLKKREGDVVTLGVVIDQAPAETELAGDGVTLKVIDSSTKTRQGELTIDVTKPLPIAGTVDFVTEVIYGDGASDTRIVQQAHRAIQFRVPSN